MRAALIIAGLCLTAGTLSAEESLRTPAPMLTLDEAVSLAESFHPAIAERAAQVRAARGNFLQVGLPPNPTVGYLADEIGNEQQAGLQGMYASQQFVRGNKLELNRQVASRQVQVLQQNLIAEQMRVRNQVRMAFFDVLIAQREIEVTAELVKVSQQAAEMVEQLLEAMEARRIDVLQAQIERDRIEVKLRQARAKRAAAWRELTVAMGVPNIEQRDVQADLDSLSWAHDWEASKQLLLEGSPQLAALMLDVSRARASVARAIAEPVPNVTAQVSVQYDDTTDYTVAGVQVGMPIPVWNRNQGGIAQARHQLTAARRRLEATELKLTGQLAQRFRQYQTAMAQADAYREGILARANENLELTRQSYEAGELGYLELLTVQRTYFESNLDYLKSLGQVNQSVQLLSGFLLDANRD